MILLDTHIWVWWIMNDARLSPGQVQHLRTNEPTGLGVSVFSCWEVAKLVELNRIQFPVPVEDWFRQALAYPGIQLLPLTPEITLESTRLPDAFHRDPADQLIVATARILNIPLLTADSRILQYAHVQTLK